MEDEKLFKLIKDFERKVEKNITSTINQSSRIPKELKSLKNKIKKLMDEDLIIDKNIIDTLKNELKCIYQNYCDYDDKSLTNNLDIETVFNSIFDGLYDEDQNYDDVNFNTEDAKYFNNDDDIDNITGGSHKYQIRYKC